ncbi:MAG: large subunit ribosomal protein [Patescibacteria group bacterium]|nr:large subunit ribosomal protein [Patescibacteria group bacterium]
MQTKSQKKELVKDLAEKIKKAKAVVFSDFKGLSVKDMTSLRRELREKGIDFKVLKKTLINVALQESKIDFDAKKMEGQIAVATSEQDEVEAAKIIAKAAKINQNIKITGGILGNKALTGEEVLELSKLPGKEELLAKLVGTLNAPVSGFVRVLSGNIRGLVQVLKAVGDSKQA